MNHQKKIEELLLTSKNKHQALKKNKQKRTVKKKQKNR